MRTLKETLFYLLEGKTHYLELSKGSHKGKTHKHLFLWFGTPFEGFRFVVIKGFITGFRVL